MIPEIKLELPCPHCGHQMHECIHAERTYEDVEVTDVG